MITSRIGSLRSPELDESTLRRLIADGEGQHLEFKESLLGRKEIGEYAVGIGNEGGGWLLMGITDRKPHRIVGVKTPTPEELQRIRDSVLDAAGIRVELESVTTQDGLVLAVRIPGRPRGQLFFTKSGKFLMRSGEGLRGMTLTEIEAIRRDEVGGLDFTAEAIGVEWRKVLDPIEFTRLRRLLREHRREELARLGNLELLRSLELLSPEGRRLQATRAAVLLLGTPEAIRKFAPSHEVKLQRFNRSDLKPDFSEDTRAPLLAALQRSAEVIEVANSVETFQAGLFRVDVPNFPPIAYREAVANALIHRDYRESGNVAVRAYGDRLEVGSPGGWFGGVNEGNILVTESRRRNELLASVLQRIGLAERSSLGVKRMFEAQLSAGKPAPEYRSTTGSVTVLLHDGTFDKAFAALVRRCFEEGRELSVFDLLVLAHLRRHREITVQDAAKLCQQPAESARRLLADLRNRKLLDRRGKGSRTFVLGPVAYERLDLTGERPRDLGISEKRFEGLLLDELERRQAAGLTSRDIREWSGYERAQTTRLLGSLVKRGAIAWSGKRGLGARYWLPRYVPTVNRPMG